MQKKQLPFLNPLSIGHLIQAPSHIIIEFAMAIKNEQWQIVDALLTDQGKFEILNYQFEFITVNKYQFIEWMKAQKEHIDIQEIQYDTLASNPAIAVVLFNNGLFPNIIFDVNQMLKNGLAITTDLQHIITIEFCNTFGSIKNYPLHFIMDMAKQELITQGWEEGAAHQHIFGKDIPK